MNQQDQQIQDRDPQVMSYVRSRMPDDMPPDFISSVMREVHRTPQRRGWSGWPMLAGAATVAAGVAVVAVGLSYVRPPQTGGLPSASPSASAAPSVGATTSPEPSETPVATAEPTPSNGAYGPIYSQAPAVGFGADVQSCERGAGQSGSPGENVRYSISLPGDWYFNPAGTYAFGDIGAEREECRLFGPEPFDPNFGPADSAGVTIEIVSGEIGMGGTVVSRTEYTVDGLPAVRFETVPDPDGIVATDPTVTWVVAIGDELPVESSNGQGGTVFSSSEAFLMISASSADAAEFAEHVEVLDKMVATLDILEP